MANPPPPVSVPSEGAKSSAVAERGTRHCVRHPSRETLVACGRCGRPFCPACLVHSPAGQRCFECAHVRRHGTQQALATRLPQVFAVAAIGSAVATVLGPFFIGLFAAMISGSLAGQSLSPLVNRSTRPAVHVCGLLALVAGALVGWIGPRMIQLAALAVPWSAQVSALFFITIQDWSFWLFVCVAAALAYQRVR